MRHITQITTAAVFSPALDEMGAPPIQQTTVALCNDGTLWALTNDDDWIRLPGIPQGDAA